MSGRLTAVAFADLAHGWLGTADGILGTSDGGATWTAQLAGTPIADSGTGLALWRIDGPLRIVTRRDGVDPVTSALAVRARLTAYGCRGGAVALGLVSPDDRIVSLGRNGRHFGSLHLAPGVPTSETVPIPPPGRPGAEACALSVEGSLGVRAERLDFLPT